MAEQKSSSALAAPLRNAASAVRKLPGAGAVTKAAEETLDRIGAVSPRGRRMAVYAGAGVLGAAGLVEWPVALTGAAVAWLTQPRPHHDGETTRPEAAGGDMTGAAGHGAYVAMGDAAATSGPGQAAAAPGPMLEDELPGGAWTRPSGAAAPATGPAAPTTPPAAGPTADPDTPIAPPSAGPAADPAAPTTPPAAPPATPPTAGPDATHTDPMAPPAAPGSAPGDKEPPLADPPPPPTS